MTQKLVYNRWSTWTPIYKDASRKNQIGKWYPLELAVSTDWGEYGKDTNAYAFTSELGWTACYIPDAEGGSNKAHAYDGRYAQYEYNSGQYVFPVRRQCRIFDSNSKIIDYIYSGDQIITDGKSDAGKEHPDRLSILGYVKNGHVYMKGSWCDTDINIGYSTNPTVYSTKWTHI